MTNNWNKGRHWTGLLKSMPGRQLLTNRHLTTPGSAAARSNAGSYIPVDHV